MNSEQVCIRTTINNTRKRGEPPIRKPHRDDTWSYGRFAHCSNYIIIQYIISYSYFVLYYHSIVYIYIYIYMILSVPLSKIRSHVGRIPGSSNSRSSLGPEEIRPSKVYMYIYIYVYIYMYI